MAMILPTDWQETFSQRAGVLGEPRAWSVIAAASDRSLLGRGIDLSALAHSLCVKTGGGRWARSIRVSPICSALYGVPPLWVQRQNAEQLNAAKKGG
ncbi:MAG: hypothetical protein U0074_05285 [Kouleothrix sp.]